MAETLSWDENPEVWEISCDLCGIRHRSSRGFVLSQRGAFVMYSCEFHPKVHTAFVEITVGDFADETWQSNATFAFQLRTNDDSSKGSISVIDSQREVRPPVLGRAMSASIARGDARLSDAWIGLNWLMEQDPILRERIFPVVSFDEVGFEIS
jgi:hypothetical protein